MHPVDLPAVEDTDLTSASEQYLSPLESGLCNNEWFQLSENTEVEITSKNVRRLHLFEDDQPDCTLLALQPPDDPAQVVALYLHKKWWCVEDVLRTSSTSRRGLMLVESIIERVIVFLLSQVVERSSQEEVLFSLHPRTESCKLLWRDGQAVGFYTVKHKGSLCDSWSGCCYLLPVLDTILVRRSCRRRGFGLQMLEDFCLTFSTEKFLGVSSPLSPSMVAVCRRFLQQHKEFQEHLYEVEAPGGWAQRRNIWLNIQLGRYSPSTDDKNEKRNQTVGPSLSNKGDDLSQTTNTRGTDLTSVSTLLMSRPLVKIFSEQQSEPCNHSQGGTSPSSETIGTGCNPAAYANNLDSEAPTRPPQSLNIRRALISKPSLSTEPHREEPETEETQRGAKRVRRM
ncbi:protein FAM169B [Cheilinus undulatus]|uniref:protein FAM169B n=1 Tax=Cheilinus undulatus TaxID=241271 RepID=UPI001BD521D6|nr:protein FAM169B [Cheilinus undulatus]